MYREKSRNPYWEKIKTISEGAYTDSDTELFKGSWLKKALQTLSTPGSINPKIHVEIGCNGGHVTLGRAQKSPGDFFIGIDWKPKQIFLAAEKAKKREIKNTVFLRATAERIDFIFGPSEIDHLSIYFPDPWPKKKQKKHRYLTNEWFLKILPLLSPQGICEIKTDHKEYFEFIIEELDKIKSKVEIINLSFDLHQDHPAPQLLQIPEVTLFERLFIKDGLPIHQVILKSKENI